MSREKLRAKGTSTKERRWDLLGTNVEEHLAEMPQVQPLHTELQGALGELRSLDDEQEAARARLRDLTQRRREVEQHGERLRRRVESHLRGTFGFSSEKLLKFGIKPRSRVIRRKSAKEAAAGQAGTAAKTA